MPESLAQQDLRETSSLRQVLSVPTTSALVHPYNQSGVPATFAPLHPPPSLMTVDRSAADPADDPNPAETPETIEERAPRLTPHFRDQHAFEMRADLAPSVRFPDPITVDDQAYLDFPEVRLISYPLKSVFA